MKKTILFLGLACLLTTSCLKDGLNDFDVLKRPLSLNGTVNPTFGIPLAYGSVSIFDLMQMVQQSYAHMETDQNNVVVISYDTTATWHIDLEESKGSKSGAKSSDIVHVSRNEFKGSVLIDLFDNISFLDNAQIEIDSLKVNLAANVIAQARPGAIEAIEAYHVHVYYDELQIDVVGQDGSVYSILSLPDSIVIDSLIHGQRIVLFNDADISEAINHRPKEIRFGARMNIAFEADFFATDITENQFVADSIGITSVDIDADIKVEFPISAYIHNLSYETDIDFSASVELNEITIDSSMIFIQTSNSIPLSLLLQAKLVDENGIVLSNIFGPDTIAAIEGAQVALNPETNTYMSSEASEKIISIPITKELFDNLKKAKKIRVKAGLNTSDLNPPIQPRVSIKADDKLDIRLWAKLSPSLNIDMGVGSLTGKKGGEQ